MFPSSFPLSITVRAALAGVWLALASPLMAADGGFTATLLTEQKAAAGLNALSDPERTVLDQLVTRDLTQVRQENPVEPAGTFLTRCTPEEREQAGLNRLTPAELAQLNQLVATALMAHPKPKERPRIKDNEILVEKPKPEVHGEVSLTYGRSSGGGTFRGASFLVDYFDPATGLGLSVGVSNVTGRGFYGYYPNDFGSPYYYGGAAGLMAAPYRSSPYDDFAYGDGDSLRTAGSWDQAGHYRRRP
jgi:hypothetical protein